jgi:hypothetical protein
VIGSALELAAAVIGTELIHLLIILFYIFWYIKKYVWSVWLIQSNLTIL